MWKFTATDREPIPGLPLEASDEDFAAAVAEYEAAFGPDGKGAVAASGLYSHVKDKPVKAPAEEE